MCVCGGEGGYFVLLIVLFCSVNLYKYLRSLAFSDIYICTSAQYIVFVCVLLLFRESEHLDHAN